MKIVFKAANENAAQDDKYDGRIRAKNFWCLRTVLTKYAPPKNEYIERENRSAI